MFGKLVDPSTDNTLYALLRRAFENHANVFGQQIHVASPNVFSEMLGQRTEAFG